LTSIYKSDMSQLVVFKENDTQKRFADLLHVDIYGIETCIR